MSFENKILQIICGLTYDNILGYWCRRRNKEIQESTRVTKFVKAQIIKCLGRVIRRLDLKYPKAVE